MIRVFVLAAALPAPVPAAGQDAECFTHKAVAAGQAWQGPLPLAKKKGEGT